MSELAKLTILMTVNTVVCSQSYTLARIFVFSYKNKHFGGTGRPPLCAHVQGGCKGIGPSAEPGYRAGLFITFTTAINQKIRKTWPWHKHKAKVQRRSLGLKHFET